MTQINEPVFAEVTLDQPVVRAGETIETVKVRRPNSGELRGVSLVEAGQLQVDTLIKLIPRVTIPVLQTHEVEAMVPSDLLAIGAEIGNFLLPKRLRQASPTE